MMGWQSGQLSMMILDIAELIPRDHLLRQINQMVSFDLSLGKRYRIILPSAKQESASGMRVVCSNRSLWKLSDAAWNRN